MSSDEPAISTGTIVLRFDLPASTLKEKRSIIRPLVERMRSRFNAAVIEAGPGNSPQTAVIAAACLSTDGTHVQRQLQALLSFVERARTDAVLVDVQTDQFVV